MLNFELLADSIDAQDFLTEDLGLEYLGNSGKDIKIKCPNIFHNDKHPSCFFCREELIWHCFGCSSRGTIVDLVMQFKDFDQDKATEYLRALCGLEQDAIISKIRQRETENEIPTFKLSVEYRQDWENAFAEILRFILKRKFSLVHFDAFGIGYNNAIPSVTIPIIYGKNIINIAERFIREEEHDSKIKYCYGASFNECVWGLIDGYNPRNPFFTEGVFDALRMREAGYNAFATLTNQLSNKKLRFLQEHFIGDFTLVPDNDDGGKKMIENWKKALHVADVYIVKVKDYKDIDEAPLNKIDEYVNDRCKMMDLIKTMGFK